MQATMKSFWSHSAVTVNLLWVIGWLCSSFSPRFAAASLPTSGTEYASMYPASAQSVESESRNFQNAEALLAQAEYEGVENKAEYTQMSHHEPAEKYHEIETEGGAHYRALPVGVETAVSHSSEHQPHSSRALYAYSYDNVPGEASAAGDVYYEPTPFGKNYEPVEAFGPEAAFFINNSSGESPHSMVNTYGGGLEEAEKMIQASIFHNPDTSYEATLKEEEAKVEETEIGEAEISAANSCKYDTLGVLVVGESAEFCKMKEEEQEKISAPLRSARLGLTSRFGGTYYYPEPLSVSACAETKEPLRCRSVCRWRLLNRPILNLPRILPGILIIAGNEFLNVKKIPGCSTTRSVLVPAMCQTEMTESSGATLATYPVYSYWENQLHYAVRESVFDPMDPFAFPSYAVSPHSSSYYPSYNSRSVYTPTPYYPVVRTAGTTSARAYPHRTAVQRDYPAAVPSAHMLSSHPTALYNSTTEASHRFRPVSYYPRNRRNTYVSQRAYPSRVHPVPAMYRTLAQQKDVAN